MSAELIVNDEELTLYALRLLPAAESDAIARQLNGSASDRRRLAEIELTLGFFAEATVDFQEVPPQSLQRLLTAIEHDPGDAVAAPRVFLAEKAQPKRWSFFDALPWAGWAVAAALILVVAGHYVPHQSQLTQQLADASARAQEARSAADTLAAEKNVLQSNLQEKNQQVASVQNKALDAEQQAAALRAKADNALVQASREGARASDLASVAEAARRDRDALEARLHLESAANAQNAVTSADAKNIMTALSDPTALRVSLSVPKKSLNPSGRGTYVASTGALIFTASNLPLLKTNKVYELWLMPRDGSSPLPAGTFVSDAAGNATLVTARFQKSIAAKGFAVTVENAGGSQTPTLPILLAGG